VGVGRIVHHRDDRRGELGTSSGALVAHQVPVGPGETRPRFVDEEHLGPAGDGAAERHPLTLGGCQLVGEVIEQAAERELFGDVAEPAATRLEREPADQEREGEVIGHGPVGVEAVVGEHEGHRPIEWRDSGEVAAVDPDRAVVGDLQAGEEAERGRGARSVAADERDDVAVVDRELEADQRVELPGSAVRHRLELDRRHQRLLPCGGSVVVEALPPTTERPYHGSASESRGWERFQVQ
jgi:hypothetical protein